jgi:hypothetical protein
MANDAKKVSELAVTTTLSANDRVVILSNPSSAANTKTITATNFANSLITSNIIPTASNTQLGVIKVDGTTITVSNGVISVTTTTGAFNPNFTTNTGNVLVGMTQTGNYTKTGKICYFRTYMNFANVSSFADGSGQYQITLPFPSIATISIRGGSLHNVNTASIYHIGGIVEITSNASVLGLYYTGSTTDLAWKNTTPVGWFTGNTSHFDISGIYETT